MEKKASFRRQFFQLERLGRPVSNHSMNRIGGEPDRCHDSRMPRGRGTPTDRIGGESGRSHDSPRGLGTYVPHHRAVPTVIRPRSPIDGANTRRTHAEHSYNYGPNSHHRRVETEFQEREFRRRNFHNERFVVYPRRDPETQIHRKSRQRPPFIQDRRVQRNPRITDSVCDKNVSSQSTSCSDSNHKSEAQDKEIESKKLDCSNSSAVSMDLGTDEDEENKLKETCSSKLDLTNSLEQKSSGKSDNTESDSTPSNINKDISVTTSTSISSSSCNNTSTNSPPVPPKQTDTVSTSGSIGPGTAVNDPRLQKRSRSSEVFSENKESEQDENITTKLADPRKQPMGNTSRSVPLELKLPQFCKSKFSCNKKVSVKKPAAHIVPNTLKKGGHINDKKSVCIKNRVELKKYNKRELEKFCCHVRIQKDRDSFQELSEVSIESLIDTRKSYLESKKEDEQHAESIIDASTQERQHSKEIKVKKTSTDKENVRKHVKSSSIKVHSKHKIVAGKVKGDQLHNIEKNIEVSKKTKDKVASVSSKDGAKRHASTGLKRKILESPPAGTATKKHIHKHVSSSVGKANPKRPRLTEDKEKVCKKLVKSSASIDRTKEKKIDNTSHKTITYIVQSSLCQSSSNHSTIACTSIVPKGKSLPMIVDDDSDYNITEENCAPLFTERSSTPCLDERDDIAGKEYSLHIPEGSIDSSDSLIRALDETIKDINVSISSKSKVKDTGKQTSSLVPKDDSPRSGVLESRAEFVTVPNESTISTQDSQNNAAVREEEKIDEQNNDTCSVDVRREPIISSPKFQNNEIQQHQECNTPDKQSIEDCSSESVSIHSESKTDHSDTMDESMNSSLENQDNSAKLLTKDNNAIDEKTSADFSVKSVLIHNELMISSPKNQDNVADLPQKRKEGNERISACVSEPLEISNESISSSPKDQKNVVECCQKGNDTNEKTSAVCTGISTEVITSSPKNQNNVTELCQRTNETDEQTSASCSEEYLGLSHESITSSPQNLSDLSKHSDEQINGECSPVAQDANCAFDTPQSEENMDVDEDIISKGVSELLGNDEDEVLLHVRVIENPEIKKEADEVTSDFHFDVLQDHIEIKTEINEEDPHDVQSSENLTNEPVVNTIPTTSAETSAIPFLERQTVEENVDSNVVESLNSIKKLEKMFGNNFSIDRQENSSIGPQGYGCSKRPSGDRSEKAKLPPPYSALERQAYSSIVPQGYGCSRRPSDDRSETQKLLPPNSSIEHQVYSSIGPQGYGCSRKPSGDRTDTPGVLIPTANQMNPISEAIQSNEPVATVVTNQSNISTINPINPNDSGLSANLKRSSDSNYLTKVTPVPENEKRPTLTCPIGTEDRLKGCTGFPLMPPRRLLPQMLNLSNASAGSRKTQKEINHNFFDHAYNLMSQYISVEKTFHDTDKNLRIFNKHYNVEVDICNLNYTIRRTKMIFGDMLLCNLRALRLHLNRIDIFVLYLMEYLKRLIADVDNKPLITRYLLDLIMVHQEEYETSEFLRIFKKCVESDFHTEQNLRNMTKKQYGLLKNQICHYIRILQNNRAIYNNQNVSRSTETLNKNTPPPNVCIFNGSKAVRPTVNMKNSQLSATTNDMNHHAINTVSNSRVSRQNSGSNDNTANKRLSTREQNITNVCQASQKSSSQSSGGVLMVHGNLQRSIPIPQVSYGNMNSAQPQLLYAPNVISYQAQGVPGIHSHSLGPNAQNGGVNVTISTQFNANYSGYHQPRSIPSHRVAQKRANVQDDNHEEPEEKRRKTSPPMKTNAGVIEKNTRTVNSNARNASNNLQIKSSTMQINTNGIYESHNLHTGFGSATVQNVVCNSATCCVTAPTASSGRVYSPVVSYTTAVGVSCNSVTCVSAPTASSGRVYNAVISYPTAVGNQDVASATSRQTPPYNVDMRRSRFPIYTPDNRCCSPSAHKPDQQSSIPPTTNLDIRSTPPTDSDIPYPTPPQSQHTVIPTPTPPMSIDINPNDMSPRSNPELPSEKVEPKQDRPSTPSEETETKPFVSPSNTIFPSEIIDLTYFDDDEPIIKEEASEMCNSAESQNEVHSEGVLILENRICVCGKVAEYLCACNTVMYCSTECQLKDWWINHQRVCSSVIVMTSGA